MKIIPVVSGRKKVGMNFLKHKEISNKFIKNFDLCNIYFIKRQQRSSFSPLLALFIN